MNGVKALANPETSRTPRTITWSIALVLRGILPVAFAVAMGLLVGAVQRGDPLASG